MYNPEEKNYQFKKKSKGINKKHLKQRTTIDNYLTALNGKKVILDNIYSFKAKGLQTYSIIGSKIALSGEDNKRILQDNKINTHAIGHKNTI